MTGSPTAVVVGVGAERGLGAALSRRFAAEGHHVLVAGRTAGRLDQVVASILAAGGSAEVVATDATREADVHRLFDRAMAPGEGRAPGMAAGLCHALRAIASTHAPSDCASGAAGARGVGDTEPP